MITDISVLQVCFLLMLGLFLISPFKSLLSYLRRDPVIENTIDGKIAYDKRNVGTLLWIVIQIVIVIGIGVIGWQALAD